MTVEKENEGELEENLSEEKEQEQLESEQEAEGLEESEEKEVVEDDYANPHLAGRSKAEVDGLVGLYEERINELNIQVERQKREESGEQGEEFDLKSSDFYDDPGAFIDKKLETTLDRVVAPLQEYISEGRRESVIARARQELKHFEEVEDYVYEMAKQQDVDLSDYSQLRYLYFATVGFLENKGVGLGKGRVDDKGGPEKEKRVPPQHKPGTSPVSERSKKKTKVLTETERRMAKEWNMTDEEYIEEMNKHADEVLDEEEEA